MEPIFQTNLSNPELIDELLTKIYQKGMIGDKVDGPIGLSDQLFLPKELLQKLCTFLIEEKTSLPRDFFEGKKLKTIYICHKSTDEKGMLDHHFKGDYLKQNGAFSDFDNCTVLQLCLKNTFSFGGTLSHVDEHDNLFEYIDYKHGNFTIIPGDQRLGYNPFWGCGECIILEIFVQQDN